MKHQKTSIFGSIAERVTTSLSELPKSAQHNAPLNKDVFRVVRVVHYCLPPPYTATGLHRIVF